MTENWAIAIIGLLVAAVGSIIGAVLLLIWQEVRQISAELALMVKREECQHNMEGCYSRLNRLERDMAAISRYHKGVKMEEIDNEL